MDKLAALNAFAQVARHGSFAAAARALGQSRSHVNRLVIALEDSLGVALLTRTTRSLSLTPAGQAFFARCDAILDDLSEAMREVQLDHAAPQGAMKINAPMSFGTLQLGPALVEFMRRYPRIHVELTLSDRFIDPVAEGFDVTVRIARRIDSPSLIVHDIVRVDRLLCAAPSLLERHGVPAVAADLARIPCLHYGDLRNGGRWPLTGPDGTTVEQKVNGVLCSNNAEVLCQAAADGMGVALLPEFIAASALRDGRLVPILPGYAAPEIHLSLIYPPNRHLSARVRAFVTFMQERFGEEATESA